MNKNDSNIPSRSQIKIGQRVWAVEKKNYASGKLTEGIVKRILTSKQYHPRGIKVMFEDGTITRVQRLTPPERENAPIVKKPTDDFEIDEDYELR